MVKIEIREKCINQDDKKRLSPGDVVDVSEFEAGRLCAGGFAVPVVENKREVKKKKYERRTKRSN